MAAPEEADTQAATSAPPEPSLTLDSQAEWADADDSALPITHTELAEGIPEADRGRIEQAEQRVQRRAADAALFERLAAERFTGPAYERFANELAAYGLAVMQAWLRTGHIFRLVRAKGIRLHPTEHELMLFARSEDERQSLALTTVTVALTQFKQRAQADTGWSADGGANITTYFMGACVLSFPNELARVRRADKRWSKSLAAEERTESFKCMNEAHGIDTSGSIGRDPASIVAGTDQVERTLTTLTDKQRQVVLATLQDYTHDEIAELFSYPSGRAVEGVLYRLRRKAQSTVGGSE